MLRPVSFYLPEREALGGLDPVTVDPDRDWRMFGTGVYVWILQTFLRLHADGAPVQLVETPPDGGLAVAHADHVERLLGESPRPGELTVASVRADRRPQILADVEIVQNAASAGGHRIFIPHWLQQGLVPREPTRGAHVEAIAYIGNRQQLHDDLADPAWEEVLVERGLRWDNRMVTFIGNDQPYLQQQWHDYSGVDVIVAVRPPQAWRSWSKPAAKLYNAWAAGVPAVLSPEVAYRELRRSPLDYLEARSAAEVLAAIERLRADPQLYGAMVANGLERAREFSHERLLARWTDVLWRQVPARTSARHHRLLAGMRGWRAATRRLRGRRRSTPGTLS